MRQSSPTWAVSALQAATARELDSGLFSPSLLCQQRGQHLQLGRTLSLGSGVNRRYVCL